MGPKTLKKNTGEGTALSTLYVI